MSANVRRNQLSESNKEIQNETEKVIIPFYNFMLLVCFEYYTTLVPTPQNDIVGLEKVLVGVKPLIKMCKHFHISNDLTRQNLTGTCIECGK